jgi:predicted HAD superfamily Cof-like phosphohydrolase
MTSTESWASAVEDFIKRNGYIVPLKPTADLAPEVEALRLHLMLEELGELSRALNEKDIIHAADAISDLLYVVVGTGVQMGLGPILDVLFREVHRSNMTKDLGPSVGPLGSRRATKGKNFQPPQVREIVENYTKLFQTEK